MTAAACAVAVLGGGPAGCAAALSLRRRGVDGVVLVEGGDRDRVRVGESLPPDTRVALERLGVWESFLADGHEPCVGSCSAWGADELGYNDFLFNPHGNGWHLDRRRFDPFLAESAAAAGAEVRVGTRFAGAEPIHQAGVERPDEAGFKLRLAGPAGRPNALRARVVVDATGGSSRFARAMGVRQLLHDRLSCVTAFLEPPAESVLSRLTMLEAVEYGWWYAAKLPGGRLAVAVASDPETVREAPLHTPDGWLAGLRATRHLAGELAGCRVGGEGTVARTARSLVLDRACGRDWLAVGDAACSYDPLSSRGIHTALEDGLRAGELVAARLAGDATALDGHHPVVAARFADYLANRNWFYGLERRWQSAPFWRRRRARTAAR